MVMISVKQKNNFSQSISRDHVLMSKYCLFLIVIYYLTGGNNSMSRFCKFGKLHVTKGNVDKLLGILLTASKELKRSLAPTGNLYR